MEEITRTRHNWFNGRTNSIHGWTEYLKNGKRHRLDGPAVIGDDGSEFWFNDGIQHRDDGPAVTNFDGNEYWYQNGLVHREDGPAIIRTDGSERWVRHGETIGSSMRIGQ